MVGHYVIISISAGQQQVEGSEDLIGLKRERSYVCSIAYSFYDLNASCYDEVWRTRLNVTEAFFFFFFKNLQIFRLFLKYRICPQAFAAQSAN